MFLKLRITLGTSSLELRDKFILLSQLFSRDFLYPANHVVAEQLILGPQLLLQAIYVALYVSPIAVGVTV